jgi:Asp-tRNA(Asn)/Glu-tRNA(Gln) amidotransferase A subunit family amidase
MTPDRRFVLRAVAALGVGTPVFQKALAAQVTPPEVAPMPRAVAPPKPVGVTPEMVKNAEWVAGITLTDEQRKQVAAALSRTLSGIAAARKIDLPNHVPPAFQFNPTPGQSLARTHRGRVEPPTLDSKKPDDLAFASVAELGHLLRSRQVSSVELTKLALDRLAKYDPLLKCVVTLTEDAALKRARQADEELAAGVNRGPLHGIPWGAKDLIAYPGYPTTWGAAEYKGQTLHTKGTVAKRLDDAGAVLVAKLTLGALALGDQWFGGMTRNPWNPEQGSSGSSAGPASAVAAGLVPFAIGSETLGSIVSPSTRCGVTGLRPTFGRVSRYGCMTLSWTMDKIGPMTRSAEDCALVFGSIHGSDPLDPTAVDRPFNWPATRPLRNLRVGYVEGKKGKADRPELDTLRRLGVKLVPITLPNALANTVVGTILDAECGSAFDDLTRNTSLETIGRFWPTTFREARFVSAVDYLRAMRLRTRLMQDMARVMETVDLYVGGNDLQLTNLTGHPTVCLPNGFRKMGEAEVPTALTFTGRLYGETDLLAVAHAYQQATGHHLKHPTLKA